MEFFSGFDPDGPVVNWTKRGERFAFLREHPEARVRIDTDKLKLIIPYKAFRCYSDCSIARDEAIKGSDVDGGLVVLNEPCSLETQMRFIEELRRQGFTAYHEMEYRKLVEDRRKNPPTIEELLKRGLDDEIPLYIIADSSRIVFHTVRELNKIIKNYGSGNKFYPGFDLDYSPPTDQIYHSFTTAFDIDTREINNLYLALRSISS